MFRHEGPARDPRLNARVAAYLAFVAGFVNSGGFLMVSTFTSHVTGNVGRASLDAAHGDFAAALGAAALVVSFFLGAFGASLVLESHSDDTPRAYGLALSLQTLLLGCFVLMPSLARTSHPQAWDFQAAFLCAAMGMQNSLVTRLSGAIVRTTHLTGIVTDLGIEAARWCRSQRGATDSRAPSAPNTIAPHPAKTRSLLLVTILASFGSGALLGAVLTLRTGRWAMTVPAAATMSAALFAFFQRRSPTARQARRK